MTISRGWRTSSETAASSDRSRPSSARSGRAWEAFDIRLVLERNWPALGPRLAGKLHVITGARDTFYLEGAARLLKESLAALGSDAVVEVVPGKDHDSILDSELAARLDREMKAALDHARASDAISSPAPAPLSGR
jgi:S-formylglutathione hydrolase FrmB